MQIHRPSKLKVLVTALVFGAALGVAQPRPAHAFICFDPYGCAAVLGIIVTVVAVKTVVCTPVAVFKASDHPKGFTGAFGECFGPGQKQTAAAPIEKDHTLQSEPEELTQQPVDSAPANTEAEASAQ